nr:unnamed protein product [Callosobruchus analis]
MCLGNDSKTRDWQSYPLTQTRHSGTFVSSRICRREEKYRYLKKNGQKQSEQAKKRLEKIKNDPVLLAEKERLKYLRKKEKGQRECVKDMTPRDNRKVKNTGLLSSLQTK